MFVADKWDLSEYSLLDCDGGDRLESWAGKVLIRPDPQIIWKSGRTDPMWNKADAVYSRAGDGGGCWKKKNIPEKWNVSYGELKFAVSPMGFKHTGLFPEQAANWDWFSDLIKSAGRQVRVLNLFAYTGGATVAAAKAGAFVCHVDASKGMVGRAKENAALSGIAENKIRYIVDDCVKFTEREIRRGNRYDAVILDPPSYGRGPGGERWTIEESIDSLLETISFVLSDEPLFLLLNSYTTGLSASTMGYMVTSRFKRFGGETDSGELGLPVRSSGLFLPCGASTRCEF